MFAIIEISGFQYEVKPNTLVKTQLIPGNIGDDIEIDKVLFVDNDSEKIIGRPYLNAKVRASIIAQGKDPKVKVFKKQRRKDNRRLRGHRQHYTLLEIKEISLS